MLKLENISLNFDEFSLKNISFKVVDGEYFVLLGESGAGKSLILEIVAGLVKPDKGKIILSGKEITNVAIQKRQVGIVFQDYAIFPHLSVKENICYPLKANKIPKYKREKIVMDLAEKMGISKLLHRKPATLSGGEMQRVALARTLTLKPKILLLDEPLSSLDVQLKNEMRDVLRKLSLEGLTIIHVTHDYQEAVALAQKVGIIHNGSIIQTGTLKEVFHTPKSKFVANLTGIRNFYNADVISSRKVFLEKKVEISTLPIIDNSIDGFIFFRSEDVVISCDKMDSSLTNSFGGIILSIIPTISGIEIVVDAGIIISSYITEQSVKKLNLAEGKKVWVSFKAAAVRFIGR